MAEPAPKCGHCRGMGLEPDVYPAAKCTACLGTGKPAAAAAAPPPTTGELLDG